MHWKVWKINMDLINSPNSLTMNDPSTPKICLMGLGGAGCNTVNRLAAMKIPGVQLIAANTDFQTLNLAEADHKLLLGPSLASGKGAGGDANIGKRAAEESFRELISLIQGTDLLFLTAGLGGGTGSGAIQIAARIARSLEILNISIVSLPFSFEASTRQQNAREAAANLQPFTDTMITIPNDQILKIAPSGTPMKNALGMADEILIKSILGISELVYRPGLMDVDISHLIRMMRMGGGCYISTGSSQGQNAAVQALQEAMKNPLLENIPMQQASGVVFKLSGQPTIEDLNASMAFLRDCTSDCTEIIPAISDDNLANGAIHVTLLVTGIGATSIEKSVGFNQPDKQESIKLQPDPQNIRDLNQSDYYHPDEEKAETLEMPAFLRKGYNLIEHTYPNYG